MSAMLELESWLIYQYVATECGDCLFMTESAFRARDIGLRTQKKILSRMAGKHVVKAFIDDTTASLLDNLYKLAKQYSGNKKEAEKLIKNIIKIVIKIGLLHRNDVFSEEELQEAEKFKQKFRTLGMAVISFYEVDFSYDRRFLVDAFSESKRSLVKVVAGHLTEKSMSKIEGAFEFFGDGGFLDAVFERNSPYRETLGRVVNGLNKAIETGDL
ncbi:unnamed protein product [Phyllotreta striolata]|uniref:Tumor necrosis factor alpha-induced protein 8-like protein n=1 Tax=Phyllotreta striolata TaxID=444603 RepID=A0A9N9TZD2_PHYSR|nr:unnamed protein product [Phyllotreta striolata]